jgi:hypothetical protein
LLFEVAFFIIVGQRAPLIKLARAERALAWSLMSARPFEKNPIDDERLLRQMH